MTGPVPFRAVLHHARLTSLSLYYIRYEPEVLIRSGPPRNYYLLLLPLAGECRITRPDGTLRIEPGQIGLVNPDVPLRMHWLDGCTQLVAKIDRAAIEQTVEAQTGQAPARPVQFQALQPVPAAECDTLVGLFDLILADLDRPRSTVGAKAGEQSAETLFVNMLLRQVPNSLEARLDRPASRAAPYYVKRVEEFVRLHAARPIAMRDLVDVAGASERTLYKGFRQFRGTGPMAYVKAVRLERARDDLLSAAETRSIAQIARAWGFRHLGNFAKDYQARFGERPSDTRRRAAR